MRLAYKWQAALVVALGLFMAVLDNTIVNVALPQMRMSFHTDQSTINWVATAYFLAQAAIIPVTGYLSDRIGSKRVFMLALTLFTIGSALCAFTPQFQSIFPSVPGEQLLIIFRIIQGIGGGALFPVAFAIIFRVFPPAERGPASAVLGVPILLAPAFGPTIGGYLTTTFDWSAIFTVNIPIGIIALVLSAVVLRGHAADSAGQAGAEGAAAGATVEPAPRARFDILGLLLSMSGFTALVYGITQAGPHGWGDETVVRFLIAGGVLLVLFVITELIVKDPVMDVRLFLNYTFTSANVLMWGVGALLFGGFILLPIFFETVQGKTPLDTGVALIAQGVAAAVATVFAGRLYNVVGPRIMVACGFLLISAGTYGFTQLTPDSSVASLQIWLVLRGLGLGLTNIPLQTLALSGVSNRAMARASSLVNVMRQVFSAVGIAVLTTYFTQQATSHGQTIKDSLLAKPPTGVGLTCIQHVGLNPTAIQACATQYALTAGLNDAFFLTMIGCAICVALALFTGRDPNLLAMKRARARGESVEPKTPVMAAE